MTFNNTSIKPHTLAQLAEELATGAVLQVALGNFLDAFYRRPDVGLLADEPPLLAGSGSQPINAYMAGIAEHLARTYKLAIPAWVFKPCRYLQRPKFGNPSSALRATLLIESPPAFRARNIFVTANALDRASRRHVG